MVQLVTIPVNLAFSLAAFAAADKMIRSQTMRKLFLKAGLFGKDLNKTSDERV